MPRETQEGDNKIKFLGEKVQRLEAEKSSLEVKIEYMSKASMQYKDEYIRVVDRVMLHNYVKICTCYLKDLGLEDEKNKMTEDL